VAIVCFLILNTEQESEPQSERIPRPDLSGLLGWRANLKMADFLTVEDSLQLAAGGFS
jgi:hypothetical protein